MNIFENLFFHKTIIYFTGLGIRLDKTRQNPGGLSFILQKMTHYYHYSSDYDLAVRH